VEGGGCSCREAGTTPAGSSAGWLVLVGLTALARGRRRRPAA
jgi:MYXO-CTERM domain-containing protein